MASLLIALVAAPHAAAALDSDGWTKLVPSPDSRIIYVSDSQGNDSNDGMTPQTPVKTIAKGYSLLRNGFPDWLLLKRGDTFTDQAINTSWNRSGRSLDEPMVVSSYGDSTQRPKILSPPSAPAIQTVNGSHNHLAFVGLHIEPFNRQPNQTPRAIRWLASTTNFLVEDCYMAGFRDNMAFQSYNGSTIKNVRIRRNVIVDAWGIEHSSHSQGIYVEGVQGLLLEENVFDHNGWNPSISGAHQTIYNHNMYIQYGGTTDVVVRGNIIARGSATGVQQRPGGICEDNLMLRNPTNILFGHFQSTWPSMAAAGVVRNNVVFDSMDIGSSPRGFGIWLQKVDNVQVYGNVVARQKTGSNNIYGIHADYNYQNLSIHDNVVFDWKGGSSIQFFGTPGGFVHVKNNLFQQPNSSNLVGHSVTMNPFTYANNQYFSTKSSAFNPGSSFNGWLSASAESGATWNSMTPLNSCASGGGIEEYMQCLGHAPTIEAFIAEARKQSRMNWRSEFTADAVNAFVRPAYGLPADGL